MAEKKREFPPLQNDRPQSKRVADRLKFAIDAHRQGRLDEAEKTYQSILKVHPDNPDALHFFGVLLHQRGRSKEAIGRIERALRIDPAYLDARINLGNVYKETGDLAKAEAIYRKVIAARPEQASAYNNLGVVLRKSGSLEEAEQALQQALALDPDNADFLHNLGSIYQDQNRYDEAVQAYTRSISHKPKQSDAYKSLWRMLRISGLDEQAEEVIGKWLAVDPDNPIAKHYFYASKGEAVPGRASDAYVQQTFDTFAPSFDDVLKKLEYRAPELCAEALAMIVTEPRHDLTLLDAGCGTGLCGPLLRSYAHRLIGVDLSQAMLEKARGRELYDELVQAELVDYIARYQATFDVIVSADTLCYFGKLDAFFDVARDALKQGGKLIFTVEEYPGGNDLDFKLNPHGRYSHLAAYVERTLTDCGLGLSALRQVILRMERGEAVAGLLVSALKQ